MIAAIQALAIIAAIFGTWMLQVAWRLKDRSWLFISLAWGAIIVSLFLWGATMALDKGIALGVVVWVCVALAFLLRTFRQSPLRPARASKNRDNVQNKLSVQGIGQGLLAATLIGPLAGLASWLFCTAMFLLFHSIGLEHTANLTITSLLFPILWALFSVVLGYQRKLWTRAVTLSGIAVAPIIYLWLSA